MKISNAGIVVYTYRPGTDYFIEWSRIRHERDVLGWISHLSEKAWFTPEMCAVFIEHCARKLEFKYRPLP